VTMSPLLAAELCVAAYSPIDQAEVIAARHNLAFNFFDVGGTQSYLFFDDKRVILAYRGTELTDIRDILADFTAWKTDGPFGRVHRGFQDALDRVWTQQVIQLDKHSGKRLFLTGHSLGGALATLAASWLVNNQQGGNRPKRLITFGSPRVGNYTFTRTLEERFQGHDRFVNCSDLVPRMPRLNYYHTGWLRYFDIDGQLHKNPSGPMRLWDRLKSYSRNRRAAVHRHGMQQYYFYTKRWFPHAS